MSGQREIFPRCVVLPLGEVKRQTGAGGAFLPPVPVFGGMLLDREAKEGPLFGVVQNSGSEVVTFSVEESADDDDHGAGGDAYAAINIRVAGAAVASVDVNPGARVVFSIEPASITDDYLRFKAASPSGGEAGVRHGYMVLAGWFGKLERYESRATA